MRQTHLALALVVASACGPSGPPEPFHGDWRITSAATPGPSALAPATSPALVGTEVSFRPGRARIGDRVCNGATYAHRSLSAETFAEAYRVTPQQLSLGGGPVSVVDVLCENGALEAGSMLVLKSATAMLTLCDGVFYELTKP